MVAGWEGASCCPDAIRAKGQHEADLFVMSLYNVLSVLVSCQFGRGWFPSPIWLASYYVSEITLKNSVKPHSNNHFIWLC